MAAISNRMPSVAVEYDGSRGREVKNFKDAYVARRFFVSCDKAGKNPVVLRSETMAKKKVAVSKNETKTTGNTKKKAAPKKKSAPVAVKEKNTEAKYGIDRDHDLPWNDKKVAVFAALKSLGASSPSTAKSTSIVAKKAGVSERDVRHYVYHARAAGLTDVADVEGVRGHALYLTAKGAAIDPKAALKEQESAKKSK